MPRKYNPSPETQQDQAEARKAGFIRASEACEVLGIHAPHLPAFADDHKIKTRTVGREVWYSVKGISDHLFSLRFEIDRRSIALEAFAKQDADEIKTGRALLKKYTRKS